MRCHHRTVSSRIEGKQTSKQKRNPALAHSNLSRESATMAASATTRTTTRTTTTMEGDQQELHPYYELLPSYITLASIQSERDDLVQKAQVRSDAVAEEMEEGIVTRGVHAVYMYAFLVVMHV